jgi:PKD repeat protein
MKIPKRILFYIIVFLSCFCEQHNNSSVLSAAFVFSPSSPAAGQTVRFSDTSAGNPTQWRWGFGDNTTDNEQNPSHIYSMTGSYLVTLTITAGLTSDSASKTVPVESTNVITAASPALADVQAAIAAASSGDTVTVPAGAATWSNQLLITKGIKLLGAGSGTGGTLITSGFHGYGEYADTNYLIVYRPASPSLDEPFRLSGFGIDCATICGGIKLVNTSLIPITRIRIDHNKISRANLLYHHVCGTVFGVADNNTIDGSWHTNSDMVDHQGLNERTWVNQTFDFGGADNWYWEDNTIICRNGDVFDAYEGGRYAARYNTITNVNTSSGEPGTYPCFNFHGNQSGYGQLSAIGCEIYGNTMNGGNVNGGELVTPRGGKMVCYNNNVTGNEWTGAFVRDESNDYDNPPAVSPISGQPQHVSDSYFWNNTQNGTAKLTNSIDATINYGSRSPYRIVPKWDLDCWKETPGFNGSSGVGIGPLSARPASCTLEGAAWWTTDERKLYRWHTGVWELFYVPYTYPHPLRALF